MIKNRLSGRIPGYIFGGLLVFLALFPFFWMILSSFKLKRDVFAIPLQFFPKSLNPVNYQNIVKDKNYPILNAMRITFAVSAFSAVLAMFVNTMAAYSFARLEFKFKKLIWAICISTMYIPGIAILITSYLVVHAMNILDTFWVLALPGVASGYSIFFFRQFFLNLPNSLEDAALIDGCSRFRIYWNVFIPLSVSPLIVMGAGCFIGYWNSFIWPSMTVPNNAALMQMMQVVRSYSSFYGADYGSVLAAACVDAIVPVCVFFIFQRWIVQGVVLSGLK